MDGRGVKDKVGKGGNAEAGVGGDELGDKERVGVKEAIGEGLGMGYLGEKEVTDDGEDGAQRVAGDDDHWSSFQAFGGTSWIGLFCNCFS